MDSSHTKHSFSESGGFVDVHKGGEQEAPPPISSISVNCFKEDGKDLWVSDWQALQSGTVSQMF